MRILFDHNTPAPLRYAFLGHPVETAYERGWAELTNGNLLSEAEGAGFDLLISTDKGIRYQQNLAGRSLALLLIDTNDWTLIRKWQSLIVDALSDVVPGTFIVVQIPFLRAEQS